VKNSGTFHRTPWTNITSIDLDYKITVKKAVKYCRMACNTTNKLNVDMETLRHGTKGPQRPKDFSQHTLTTYPLTWTTNTLPKLGARKMCQVLPKV